MRFLKSKLVKTIVEKNISKLILLFILTIISSFLSIMPVKVIQIIINLAILNALGNIYPIIKFGLIYLGLHILGGTFKNYLNYLTNKIEFKIGHEIRMMIYSQLNEVKQTFFDEYNTQDILNRLLEDAQTTVDGFLKPIVTISYSIFSFAFGLYFMITIDWRMTLLILPIGLFSSILMKKVSDRTKKYALISKESSVKLWKKFSEGILGMKEITVSNQRKAYNSTMSELSSNLQHKKTEESLFNSKVQIVLTSIYMGVIGLIMTTGAIFVVIGYIDIGGLTAIMMYNSLLTDPLMQIASLYQNMIKISVSFERIEDVLSYETKQVFNDAPINMSNNEVEIIDVQFKYKDKLVLDKLSINVKSGEKIAIVGNSGAGKSTIFKLLIGMYTASSGQIKIGRNILNESNFLKILKNIAVVFQDVFLFDDTIRNNILLSNSLADEFMLNEVIELCCLKDFVKMLPNGLDTHIGENGMLLSGGEKKRIQIARALLKDTNILLFDEMTSSLDNITAIKITNNILRNYKDKTCIFIEHRLDVIKNVDKIYVLKDGRIIEFGNHEQLMKNKKNYYELWERINTESSFN